MIAADFHMMGNLERMVLEDMHRWLAKDGKVLVFDDVESVKTNRTVPYKKAVELYWKEKI